MKNLKYMVCYILELVCQNDQPDSGTTSWIGQTGPPSNLNEVSLFPPDAPTVNDVSAFDTSMAAWLESQTGSATISSICVYGLALVHTIYGSNF